MAHRPGATVRHRPPARRPPPTPDPAVQAVLDAAPLSATQRTAIQRRYGARATATLQSHPYRLLQDLPGLSFPTVDASRATVEQFLLYRCAELTTQLGYDHFLLFSQDTLDISDPLAKVGIFPRNYYATALIQVVRQSEQADGYDAQEVMRKVQAQYPKDLGS